MIERINYLDSLRGLAVIFMVQQHLQSWLWDKKWISYSITFPDHPVMLSFNFMGNFAAPVFLIVAGAGSAILNEKVILTKHENLKRGLFILLCGYILNIVSPHWFVPGSWYILHTIGIAIILSPLVMKLKNLYLFIISAFIFFLSPLFQTWLNTPLMIGNDQMNNIHMNGGIMRLALVEGHFPLFPWLSFFIAGIISYRWIRRAEREKVLYLALTLIALWIISAGCYRHGFFFATGGWFFRGFVFVPYIYPSHPPFMFLISGVSLIFLYLFSLMQGERFNFTLKILAPMGRLSLSWFFIHIVIFNEFFRICGLHRTFNEAGSISIITVVLFLIIFISVKWEERGYKYSIEWFMRKSVIL